MIKRRQRFHSTGSLPNFLLSTSTLSSVPMPKLKRSLSYEPQYRPIKPIMKAKTLDESLSSVGQSRRLSQSDASLDSTDRSIHFHEIHIREYVRTVGDNPSCSSGPPIAIGWDYDPNITTMKLEDYEHLRPKRRSQMEMVIPRHERYRLLREEWDIPSTTIAASVRNAVRVKHQRRVTVSNLRSDKWEEMVERASRKVTRTLLFRKSTSEKARELEEQLEMANQLRSQWLLEMMERDKAAFKEPEPVVAKEPEDEKEANPADDETVESVKETSVAPSDIDRVQSLNVEPVGE